MTAEDLKNARPEDYIRLFTQYLGQLLGYYVRYIQQGSVDLARDNLLFQMLPVYLSPSETQGLGHAITAALSPYLNNEPSPDRQRSILGLISLPDAPPRPLALHRILNRIARPWQHIGKVIRTLFASQKSFLLHNLALPTPSRFGLPQGS